MKSGLILLFLLIPAFAAIHDLRITSTISPPDSHERIVFELRNDLPTPIPSALFSLPADANEIKVEDSYGTLPFTTELNDETTKLSYEFTRPIEPGESRVVIVEYRTQQVLRKNNNEWEFLMIFLPTSEFTIEHTLNLPEGYKLGVLSPQAQIQEKDNKVSILWNVESNGKDSIVFVTRFTSGEKKIDLLLFAIGAVFLVAVFISGIFFQTTMAEYNKKKKLDAVKIVKDEDRTILEMIINNPGIRQNEIQDKLNWSKASVSKRVTNMIGQGLIEKKKKGRRNLLYPGPKLS
jgi:uncharacterized membrane protein